MASFIFSGSTLPPVAQVTMTHLWNEWSGPERLRLDVNITDSRVRVDAEVDPEPTDLLAFFNDVRELAQGMVDAYTFSLAAEVVIDLDRVVMPDGRTARLIPVFPGLRAVDDGSASAPDEIRLSNRLIELVSRSPELRSALADTRRALTSGRETAFHAYRAVESIRQHFVQPEDRDNAGPSWSRMWSALGASRALVDAFQDAATARRHGEMNAYTHDERKTALINSRDVVRLFADYLERLPREPVLTED
jgi:hypothetical protein